jgi:acetyl-CoA synthetase
VPTIPTPIQDRLQQVLGECADPHASAAWLLCDRHPSDAIALTLLDDDLKGRDVTYGELQEISSRAASALSSLGVGPGDRVATLMGKGLELVATMLGTWRLGAAYVPLFTAFGPKAIAMRLTDTAAKVVVIDADQRHKLEPGPDMPDDGVWQLVVNGDSPGTGDQQLSQLLASADATPRAYAGGGDWPFVHMHTSGTTGRPKGVVHPLTYLAGWITYLEFAVDVRDDDTYWCSADPGWGFGLYGAIAAPLAKGIRTHLACGGFSAEKTLRTLTELQITNFAAAPTVFRALRSSEDGPPEPISLRSASSAGEPLTPEVNEWAENALGVTVRDHFGQTELGMIAGNQDNEHFSHPIKPGSMGRALPGWSIAILAADEDVPVPAGTLGRMVVDVENSPLLTFHSYGGGASAAGKFTDDGRWYLTGDAASQDEDGDIFFSSRDDDVIIMAGYRIGPFDVESVLVQHDAVAECAVIAAPDEARGEVIEAVVVLAAPHEASDELARELQQLVKHRYAAHAYPRTVHFVSSLPKTPSGKIQRSVLRAQRAEQLKNAAASEAS